MVSYGVFWLLLSFSLLLSLKKRTRQISYQLTFIILFLFSALRFDVGYDYEVYYRIISKSKFDYITSIDNMEFFNRKIIYLVQFFNAPELYFIITSFIIIFLFWYTIKKESKIFMISILIFASMPVFYTASFGEIRQYVATSIIFFGFKYIKENKLLKYCGIVLIAVLFHTSAVIGIFIYFLKFLKLKRIHYIILLITANFMDKYVYIIIKIILPKYIEYLDRKLGTGGDKMLILYMVLGLMFLFIMEKLIAENKINQFYLNNFYIGLFLLISLSDFGGVVKRGSIYFILFLPLLIAEIGYVLKKKIFLLIVYMITTSLFMVTIWLGYKNPTKDPLTPYRIFFITDKTKFKTRRD